MPARTCRGRCRPTRSWLAVVTAEGRPPPALVIAGELPAVDSAFAPDPRPGRSGARAGRAGVYFTGWVDEADKAALYRMAAASLFVSEYEGFGLPVLEAMACEARRAG